LNVARRNFFFCFSHDAMPPTKFEDEEWRFCALLIPAEKKHLQKQLQVSPTAMALLPVHSHRVTTRTSLQLIQSG